MPIRAFYPEDKPFKMCYVEEPIKIVFEIYSYSYALTYASSCLREIKSWENQYPQNL